MNLSSTYLRYSLCFCDKRLPREVIEIEKHPNTTNDTQRLSTALKIVVKQSNRKQHFLTPSPFQQRCKHQYDPAHNTNQEKPSHVQSTDTTEAKCKRIPNRPVDSNPTFWPLLSGENRESFSGALLIASGVSQGSTLFSFLSGLFSADIPSHPEVMTALYSSLCPFQRHLIGCRLNINGAKSELILNFIQYRNSKKLTMTVPLLGFKKTC